MTAQETLGAEVTLPNQGDAFEDDSNAVLVDPNATNPLLTAQGPLVRDLGSRSPTAQRPAKPTLATWLELVASAVITKKKAERATVMRFCSRRFD